MVLRLVAALFGLLNAVMALYVVIALIVTLVGDDYDGTSVGTVLLIHGVLGTSAVAAAVRGAMSGRRAWPKDSDRGPEGTFSRFLLAMVLFFAWGFAWWMVTG